MEVIIAVGIIILICKFLAWLAGLVGAAFGVSLGFLSENIWFILGLSSFITSIYYLIFYNPHQAELAFKQYKEGLLTMDQTVNKVVDALYDPVVEGWPSALSSKIGEKRAIAFQRRLDVENDIMEKIIKNMKMRSRM